MSRRKFLTARWRNLILANYAVPEELLRPLVPPGCELDFREGQCWASLVGFQFLGTRVLGIGWPGFRNFPEWTIRVGRNSLKCLNSQALTVRKNRTYRTE